MWSPWIFIPGWFLVVVTVVGNGLVIFLITTRRSLRTTTNWFVLSLAVADFGVGAVYYPSRSSCSVRDGTCVDEAEKIANAFGSSFVDAAAANLCALTLDRYLAIVHPLRYVTFMTKKRVALLVSVAWGGAASVSVVVSLPFIGLLFGHQPEQLTKISLAFFTPWPAIICVFLLFATVRIFLVVRRIARQNAALVAQLNFNHKLQHGRVTFKARETSSAKMILIVVTMCLVCYSWNAAESVLFMVGSIPPSFTADVRRILVLLNSAVNPVAYAFHKR